MLFKHNDCWFGKPPSWHKNVTTSQDSQNIQLKNISQVNKATLKVIGAHRHLTQASLLHSEVNVEYAIKTVNSR